ncbi:EAL domain-containing protein [Cryobacterium sp. 10I1]|uniref:putative bifunctional diguanylate cyclase/phosphodiesterase n=1 Tax=unclassified Cryobacterium TaxID=2649013 RepID=UPI002B22F3E2|nr:MULTISPECIES: EAL domain-containing protein [unclassified Cryobacterium]MEB0201550.1 EAL domain-containing protein [Cryobacterium sp. 5I3]MEB0284983.1 EAL domain-containing protein [Cryobacterium sp. 10S3]MEB0306092.1 EAL domain-containing protein [Cryobacterium sp. 10I1]
MELLVREDRRRGAATPRSDAWLVWSLIVLLAASAVQTLVAGVAGVRTPVGDIVGALSFSAPVVLCWISVHRAAARRTELVLTALALSAYSLSGILFSLAYLVFAGVASDSLAILATALFFSFYPLVLAALAVLVHRQKGRLSWGVTLDSTVGALGAASLVVVLLGPSIDRAFGRPFSLDSFVAAANPLLDILVLAALAGVGASRSISAGRNVLMLVAGVLLFAAADIGFSLTGMTIEGSYSTASPFDLGWIAGLALMALWAHRSARPVPPAPAVRDTAVMRWALSLAVLATTAGLVVLLIASEIEVSPLAISLAAGAVVLSAARTTLAFRELRRMGDMRRQARTDDLTGLPNRRALYSEVPLSLTSGANRALLLLDLDRFKEVNDSLGHDVGDELLVQVGTRLTSHVRGTDLVARLGGDEFAILLADAGEAEAVIVAGTLREALARPYLLEGITLQTTVSIGIALYPGQALDLTGLLRKADMAMYKAKASRSGHRVYDTSDDSHGAARLRTLQELRVALAERQLELYYQPKVDLATGAVRGVESLVRWNHPVRGLVQPGDFLSIVEEAGLMNAMTEQVLDMALDQAAVWHSRGADLTVAVNLTASALVDAELPERTAAMLADRGLPASALILEITEEFLLEDRARTTAILTRLRAGGIRIAIDDFGTGYSSLAYLRDLPVDELKLDRSIVSPMKDDPRAAALVSSTIELAHSLGLTMVAEGVEDAQVYADLARYGCDEAQGFHMSRPMPAGELDRWLAERRLALTASP